VFFLMVAVIAVVVFGVAAVAAGQGGTLEPPVRDLPGPPVDPATADLAAVTGARFPVVLRGYRMDAVDAVLDRLTNEITAREALIAELTQELQLTRSRLWGDR
jgi:DivIVA domain-containing protein